MNTREVFSIRSAGSFNKKVLEIFRLQAQHNPVYKKYTEQLGVDARKVNSLEEIPFLPIEFFKTHRVVTRTGKTQAKNGKLFLSSGTSGMERSKHYVADPHLYKESFTRCFRSFYGEPDTYALIALLPSYYGNKNSSLLYMVRELIGQTKDKHSGFYDLKDDIRDLLKIASRNRHETILFGVTHALLELAERTSTPIKLKNILIIATGGMKGHREEMTREEVHETLKNKFGVKKIHSEYGMTELLSQAWSKGEGLFRCPPWMKVLARDPNDPFSFLPHGKTGALNIIDLANVHSCAFIATQDVGRVHRNGTFEVLGRMDNSDLRGCNLLALGVQQI